MNGTLNIAQVQAAFEQQQAAFVHLEATFMQQQQVAAKKFQEAAERLDADRKQHEAAATQMEELLAQHRMAASKTQLELAMLTEEETVQEVADIAEAMESFPSLPHVQRRRRSYEIEREHCQKRLEHSKIQEEGVYEEAENQERDNGAELEGGKELTAEEQARQELQEKHPLMRAEREEDIERMYEMLDHNMEVATRQALSENGPWFGGRLKMKVDWVVGQVHRTFDRVMQEGMMDSGAVSDVKRMVARVMDEDGLCCRGADGKCGCHEDVGVGIEGFDSMEDYVFHEIDAALSSLEEWCGEAFETIRIKGDNWYGALQTTCGEIEWELLKSEAVEDVFGAPVADLQVDKKQLTAKAKSEMFEGLLSMLWQVEICLLHEGDREERWSILQTCSRHVKPAMRHLVKCIARIGASAGGENVADDVPQAFPSRRKQEAAHRGKLWDDVEIPETVVEEEASGLCDDTGFGRWHDWEYVVYSEEDWSFDARVEEDLQRQFISCGRWQ